MRRVLLFAAFLLLLGLTTATAASFDVQAEDITSFSTDVSIDVPTPTPLDGTVYLAGDAVIPGELLLTAPGPPYGVKTRLVVNGTDSLEAQDDPEKYFTWALTAPANGFLLEGNVVLTMFQNGDSTDVITAGLHVCTTSVPHGSETGCTTLARAVGAEGLSSGNNNWEPRTVNFGYIPSTLIPAESDLRLKIVNLYEEPGGVLRSDDDWSLRWGFNTSFASQLDIT